MTLQINIDPGNLTDDQRQAVANFIITYPFKGQCVDEGCPQSHIAHICHSKPHAPAVSTLAAHIHNPGTVTQTGPTPELANEISILAKEGGEFDASVAFGAVEQNDPAAAFGGTPGPLPLGATPAPFTVAAVPFSTAPVVTPILTNPANAPIQLAPNPASVGVAPSVPAGVLTPANGVELDKNGLPWDARIHGSTKTKNSDGTWRAKRGVEPGTVAQVEAELRQLMGVPGPLTHAPATATTLAPQAGHVTMPTAGAAFSGVPAPASNLAAPPPDGRQLFVGLIGRASAALQANKLTQAEIGEICARHGVPALPLLANRLDLVPAIAAEIDALIAARP